MKTQEGIDMVSDTPTIVNTPKTLGVIPRYVLQHNAISRSVQSLSANAKKLTAMAMALLPADLSSRTAAFSFNDFCKALGLSMGGKTFKLFTAAAAECMKTMITVETEEIILNGKKKGKKSWKREALRWFELSEFNAETGICTMTFSKELADLLLELKKVYAKIDLHDLGKLHSRYSIRYFEMAKSYESLCGKDGNKEGTWYFDQTVLEIRERLSIPETAYTETKDFRKYVVEDPVKELNNAGIGLTINTEKIKQGRNLKSVRFNCKKTSQTVSGKGQGKVDAPRELLEKNDLFSDEGIEKKREHLKELYASEFTDLYTKALKKYERFSFGLILRKRAAEQEALVNLCKKYGIQL